MEKLCMTITEMGEVLGISRSSAYKLARSRGFTPVFYIGSRMLINRAELQRWLDRETSSGGSNLDKITKC